MPRRPRPGEWAVLYLEVPPELKAKLQAKASRNHRSLTAEATVALEQYTDGEPQPDGPPKGKKKR